MTFLAKLGYAGSTVLSSRDASDLIQLALDAGMDVAPVAATTTVVENGPAAPVVRAARVTEVGMYRTGDERIFKVQAARETKNLYAKELVPIGGKRLTETDEVVGFEFQYAPGALGQLRASDRMSLEEAKAFGIKYGFCMVCAARLKDAVSVSLGIGPVCGKRV